MLPIYPLLASSLPRDNSYGRTTCTTKIAVTHQKFETFHLRRRVLYESCTSEVTRCHLRFYNRTAGIWRPAAASFWNTLII